jgi:hypothetical protein
MNFPPVFMVELLKLDLLFVDEVLAVLIDIVSVLQEVSCILNG